MAVPCAKCGAEVPAGSHFCAVCGTQLAAAAAPSTAPSAGSGYTPVNVPTQPAASAQPAAGSQPLPGYTPVSGVPPAGYTAPSGVPPAAGYAPAGGYVQPPPAPVVKSGGGSALKIILIIFAVLVGLGILGAGAVGFMVWRVAHSFHLNGRNGQVTLNSPSGSVTASNASNFTSDELGTDVYPGAQPAQGGMRMNLPTGSVVSGVFLTPDSKDQVLAFYKSKLGSEASVFDGGNSAMISLRKGSHENIMVSISSQQSQNEGKTKISIVHTKNNHS
ncbi:MAG: zinc ribbon domain-containing protein [Terracidiphilus sp.]